MGREWCRLLLTLLVFSYALVCSGWPWSRKALRPITSSALRLRAGSSEPELNPESGENLLENETEKQTAKVRRASDTIVDLLERSGVDQNVESLELRELITSRTAEYLEDLQESNDKLPDPRKLLHYLTPKIPAVRHSPDVALKIRSARSDMDSGVAACMIGTLGYVCELYDQRTQGEKAASVELIKDRRFEQLVECLLCGVDVKKRKKEFLLQQQGNDTSPEDIEELLDEEDAKVDEGLSVRDSARAAWGLAILGVHQLETLGGESIQDLLVALSLRIRELLLGRLQQLRQDDLNSESHSDRSVEDQLRDFSDELAEDAASAMWAFGCVRACTGLRCTDLFEVCASILCQNPVEMRRRAQDAEATLDKGVVGTNDIVERLARSETEGSEELDVHESDEATPTGTKKRASAVDGVSTETKEALLEWLSPLELIDVLWALALHGSKADSSAQDEIALSATVRAFQEIAFDRVSTWLQDEIEPRSRQGHVSVNAEEIEGLLELESAEGILDPVHTKTVGVGQPVSTGEEEPVEGESDEEALGDVPEVALVDAATIIASENEAVDDRDQMNINLETLVEPTLEFDPSENEDHVMSEIDEVDLPAAVELIDAATILASETAAVDAISSIDSLKEIPETTANEETEQVLVDAPKGSSDVDNEHHLDGFVKADSNDIYQADALFRLCSPADLCSLAWAVTELQDGLRSRLISLVASAFEKLGSESLDSLTGGDLSNLAWAVARHMAEDDRKSHLGDTRFSLARWIVAATIRRARVDPTSSAGELDLSAHFHAPELSRLLWALASIVSEVEGLGLSIDDLGCLTKSSMVLASDSLSTFGTEDMSRIAWAHMFLSDPRTTPEALGKVLATIEGCLLDWESGKIASRPGDNNGVSVARESVRFASLFGRTRFLLPFLDQKLDDFSDDELPVPSFLERTRLPTLKDLSIDPLTLCKVASVTAEVRSVQPHADPCDTILRVTMRLLSSHKGRLLRECPMRDLVRICSAAARTTAQTERELVGLFARRVVGALNNWSHEPIANHDLSAVPCRHLAILLWALGELGVKYAPTESEAAVAYRRLHLVQPIPRPAPDELALLSAPTLSRLLRGLAKMGVASTDSEHVRVALDAVASRAEGIQDAEVLCELVESLGMLKSFEEASITQSARTNEERPSQGSDADASDGTETASAPKTLSMLYDELLWLLGLQAAELAKDLDISTVRRLLMVYANLPFCHNLLVDTLEEELSRRVTVLGQIGDDGLGGLVQGVAQSATSILSVIDSSEERESTLDAIKNGIKSIFRGAASDNMGDEGESIVSEQRREEDDVERRFRSHLLECCKAARWTNQVSTVRGSSLGQALDKLQQDAAFELSRCQALIEKYRRVDFDSGVSGSRLDLSARRYMTKKILSRLLPKP